VAARVLVPVLALCSLALTLHGGQGLVVLLLTGYSVVTQLFPALVLSFGDRPRVSALAAAAGIIAGELTVATVAISGASLAALIPSAPQLVKDLNVGVVALAINVAVIALVSLVTRSAPVRASRAPEDVMVTS
jgi:SSS family solute:Na+ symporter